jgi:outer membrane protein assembly factor BamB
MQRTSALPPVVYILLFTLLTIPGSTTVSAENWPQWRGLNGDGVSHEKSLPIAWSETTNILWKVSLPEWGDSTPAIWNDAIFITTQVGDELKLLRLAKSTGEIEWTQTVGQGKAPEEATMGKAKFHRLHNLASPSPVTNGEVVVAHFGNGDLAAYDFAGKQLWKLNLQDEFGPYSIWWGHANSPVIVGDLVISVCMQDSLAAEGETPQAKSYLVAHDLRSGTQKWFTARQTTASAEQCDSYTTPILRKVGNQTELVVMGGNQLDAYDPATGKQLWFLPQVAGGRTVTGPTISGDFIFTTQGQRGPLLAVQPSKLGELERRDITWRDAQGTPDTCCPVAWGELLFTITDDGIARCFHAETGNLKWKSRLEGDYKASPIAIEGRIYFLNTAGKMSVVSAAPRFDKLTECKLDDETIASPAVSGERLFIRGKKFLYCIGQ